MADFILSDAIFPVLIPIALYIVGVLARSIWKFAFLLPLCTLLLNAVMFLNVSGVGLLLSVNPCAPFSNAIQFSTICGVPTPEPPNLNPFISPLALPDPLVNLPFRNAIQFLKVTTPIGPVAVFAYKSQPSSLLLYAIQPSNTLPSPQVNFAANPSAFSPEASLLLKEVQFLIKLLLGHRSMVAAVTSYLLN